MAFLGRECSGLVLEGQGVVSNPWVMRVELGGLARFCAEEILHE